ncbi:hypothetical protein CES86_0125 [Brucella lupini]|uniref:Uncharacterized protein n=1 Tax=Brucella lupini TaxID=255457 RepID=A0A256GZB3_9HYPH|nr:hypothetical protein CES86_0125 [Brucella lupini]
MDFEFPIPEKAANGSRRRGLATVVRANKNSFLAFEINGHIIQAPKVSNGYTT